VPDASGAAIAVASRKKVKSDAAIERETAKKWLKLALDCYAEYDETGDTEWLVRATSYRDEAMEHAALIGDHGRTVGAVQRRFERECKRQKRSRR
jgi:hypothetical protein